MPSFDVVSELNMQEVDNGVNHAKKEILSRYDLKNGKCEINWDKKILSIEANDEYKLNAVKDILQSKLHKRGIDIQAIKFEDIQQMGGMLLRRNITLIQGIEKEKAKEIIKAIKDSKLKVQAQIQDEKLKVTSKSRDELQACITLLKNGDFKLPLQFNNFRD